MNENKQSAATLLLNIKCSETQKEIQLGEIVKIHNWGIHSSNDVIGYGHFDWDSSERRITFTPHKGLNLAHNIVDGGTVEDAYDLFRTSPAKLNEKEIKELEDMGDKRIVAIKF